MSFRGTIPTDKLPPAPTASPPSRPTNALHTVANGINSVIGKPAQAIELLNTGFAKATNALSAALPAFPAAGLGSLALGAPHAHVLHPPSGPPPIPPTPLPPFGAVLLGNCLSVLIEGKPAARCGDLGLSPTCCGLPPVFEIFTGSSKVFIGGARAARQLDITFHCKTSTSSCGRMAAAAQKALQVAGAAKQVMFMAGLGAQAASIAGDAVAAGQTDDPAMAAALAQAAAVSAAQIGADAVAMAMGMAMGMDKCLPPGTPGAVLTGAGTVMIGGFPMPSWTNVAKGLARAYTKRTGRSSVVLGLASGAP